MIYLRKQEKNIETNTKIGNNKLPYFVMSIVPEKDGQLDWTGAVEICALWKNSSGKGYSGKFQEGFEYDVSGVKSYKKPAEGVKTSD